MYEQNMDRRWIPRLLFSGCRRRSALRNAQGSLFEPRLFSSITPSECPGSDNPCTDGAAVNVVATNSDAQTQLNHLTEGETSGVLVCASGRTENGEFMADSIVKQD